MGRFSGDDYRPSRDDQRLEPQAERIFNCMKDGKFRTFDAIQKITGDKNTASISAQLRHLKKEKFGSHILNRRYLGNGLYEYQVIVNPLNPHPHAPKEYEYQADRSGQVRLF